MKTLRPASFALLMIVAACSTTSPSGSPAASPAAPVAVGAWGVAADRVAFDDPLGFSEVDDVVPWGAGFIAAGGDARGAATWTSNDGLGWTKTAADPDLAGGVIRQLVPGAGRLIAWGARQAFPWEETAVAWVSVDGVEWQPAEGLPDDATMRAVLPAPGGWLAFLATNTGGQYRIATSSDGRAWTPGPEIATPDSSLQAVTGDPSGYWMTLDTPTGVVARHSDNGLDWREETLVTGPQGSAQVFGLAASGSNVVAVGNMLGDLDEATATAWSSTDAGRTWSAVALDTVPSATAARVDAVGSGFVALGIISGGPDDAQPIAWSSLNGRTWSRLGLGPRDSQLTGLLSLDGRTLGWGISQEGDGRIWTSPAPSPAFSDLPPEGIACPVAEPTFRDAVLAPRDGRLACIGSEPIEGLGFFQPIEGGGVCPSIEPSWLQCAPSAYFAADAGPRVRGLGVVFGPGVTFAPGQDQRWFALTGQLDHPAAATCHSTEPVDATEAARIVGTCRGTFVVTEFHAVRAP